MDLMHGGRDETVIILSDKTKEFIGEELKSELESLGAKPESKLDLIVRQGDPLSVAELSEINIKQAKSILVMDDERSVKTRCDISAADFDAIKMVLLLARFDLLPDCPIAVEAESYKTAEMIRTLCKTVPGLKKKKVEVFSYYRKLEQFLALTALCPPMSNVLYSLLSYSGSMFYPAQNASVEKYLQTCPGGIPVATLDKTYLLAESEAGVQQVRDKPYKPARALKVSPLHPAEPLNLLLSGKIKNGLIYWKCYKTTNAKSGHNGLSIVRA